MPVTRPTEGLPEPLFPPLRAGDRLNRPAFHARYEAMPEDFRAELIGGVVHLPGPINRLHGRLHALLLGWFSEYEHAAFVTRLAGPAASPPP